MYTFFSFPLDFKMVLSCYTAVSKRHKTQKRETGKKLVGEEVCHFSVTRAKKTCCMRREYIKY